MKKIKKLNPLVTKELKNKTILITGGAGSIGSHLTKRILDYPVKAVRVLDLDEHALFRLGRDVTDKRLRPLLGNILDMERMELAGKNVDIVLHTAAIKNIEISEYNPIETINTNVNGTVNLVKMAMKNSPKKFLNISTDKAADSTTLYGTTKNLGEKLITWAGQYLSPTKFASTRFGNVIETRGNVFEIWNEEKNNKKPLSITHPSMERYFFTIDEAVEFCLDCLLHIKAGEIFIPKMKSYKIKDLANKVSKDHNTIGLRNGEKMSEILMTDEEKKRSIEKKKMWVIKSS
jgi:UDP-N-acetylglucosamine 4,6-dehydratase